MSKFISIKDLNTEERNVKTLDEECSNLVNIANNIIDKIILSIDDSFVDNVNKRILMNTEKGEYVVKIFEISDRDNDITSYLSLNAIKCNERFISCLHHFILKKADTHLHPNHLDDLTMVDILYAFRFRIHDAIKTRESDIKWKLKFGGMGNFKDIYLVFNW